MKLNYLLLALLLSLNYCFSQESLYLSWEDSFDQKVKMENNGEITIPRKKLNIDTFKINIENADKGVEYVVHSLFHKDDSIEIALNSDSKEVEFELKYVKYGSIVVVKNNKPLLIFNIIDQIGKIEDDDEEEDENDDSGSKGEYQNITTSVLEIDLSKPHQRSFKINGKRKSKHRLVINGDHPLAVKLVNGNPFRFRYMINYKTVSLFQNSSNFISQNRSRSERESNKEKTKESFAVSDISGGLDGIKKNQSVIDNDSKKLKSSIQTFQIELKNQQEKLLATENFNLKKYNRERIEHLTKYERIKREFKDTKTSILELDKNFKGLLKNNPPNTGGTDGDDIRNYNSDHKLNIAKNKEEIKELNESIESLKPLLQEVTKPIYSTYTLPIDVYGENADYVEIELQQIDISDASRVNRYVYKIWIARGIKIDFSTGIFLTSLRNRSYTLSPTTKQENMQTISGSTISEENLGNFNFGFGVMANIGYRTGGWVSPSITIGTILNSDQDFQLLTGIGLILGKKRRFIFNGGLAMGKISTLSDRFTADGTSFNAVDSNSTAPVVDKFEFGSFFGITYNLTSLKKNK